MKRFFIPLENLYRDLSRELPSFPHDPCGECYSCCKATVMGRHNVTPLELCYLESKVGVEKTDKFRIYLKQERDCEGELLFPTCPNYDGRGCSVHEYRPYSCRLYGHFRSSGENIVAHCVFRDTVKVVEVESARHDLPYQSALSDLAVKHTLYSSPPDEQVEVAETAESEFQDEFQLATYQVARKEYEKAAEKIKTLILADDGPGLRNLLGSCYWGLRRFQDAAIQYAHVVDMLPENGQAYYDLGGALLFAGDIPRARLALEECLRLQSERSGASGLLGLSFTWQDDHEGALPHYRAAVKNETGPSAFRLELARTYARLGRRAEAKAMYESALQNESTAEAARTELTTLG